jgi:hypothetical protein
MAVASLNRIWDQRWAVINHLEDAKTTPRATYWSSQEHHEKYNHEQQNQMWRQCQQFSTTTSQTRSGITLESTPCRLLGPTGMVGGVKTPCHTRLPSLNYAGSNVQPSVITHSSLTGCMVQTDIISLLQFMHKENVS